MLNKVISFHLSSRRLLLKFSIVEVSFAFLQKYFTRSTKPFFLDLEFIHFVH